MLTEKQKITNLAISDKSISEIEFKKLLEQLKLSFDKHHTKMSIISRCRTLYNEFFNKELEVLKNLIVNMDADGISETLTIPNFKGLYFSIKTKTFNKQNLDHKSIKPTTITTLNLNVEKAKRYFDENLFDSLGKYFWDIITLSNDCMYEVYCDKEEFVFKYEIPNAKTVIEVIVYI